MKKKKTTKKTYSGMGHTYICTECGKSETIDHINPIIEPYLCFKCWFIKNNITTKGKDYAKR